MSGPSDKAVEAAATTLDAWRTSAPVAEMMGKSSNYNASAVVLRAAHDPSLGLHRSVCLRNVVTAFEKLSRTTPHHSYWDDAVAFLEREFGGGT